MRLELTVLLLLAVPAAGLEPYLVKDIDPVPAPGGSGLSMAVTFDGAVFFFADDGIPGSRRQLWRSDGTPAGTFQVSGAGGGLPDPRPFAVTERLYFFLSNPALHGFDGRLWVTDGTPAGTFLVTAPGVVVDGNARLWVASQGVLYFTAWDEEHGAELWRSDGTPAGTYLVADVRPGAGGSNIRELVEHRGRIWFAANDGRHGGALWSTDGTASGTVLAVDPVPSSAAPAAPDHIRVVGGRLAFFAPPPGPGRSRQLWAGDGTAAGTHPVTSLVASRRRPAALIGSKVFGGRLLFLVDDGRDEELWVSDGTARGTRPLAAFASVDAFPLQEIVGKEGDGRLVFTANDGRHGAEPWITDGTPQGTYLLRDACPGRCSSFAVPERVLAGRLYFTVAPDLVHSELWVTDGTPRGTVQLTDLCSRVCGFEIFGFFEVDGRLLFVAWDDHGWEVWRTDGTATGTVRVTDFEGPLLTEDEDEGAELHGAVVDGQLLFGADDGEHGNELWRTDGTAAGTWLVEDIDRVDRGGSLPRGLRALGDEVVFETLRGDAPALWKSDGTAEGTVRFRTFAADELDGAHPFGAWAQAGGALFYFSSSFAGRIAPWRTDGTAAGTFRLTDGTVPVCCESEMEAVGSTVFFSLWDEAYARQLWASDGTAAGTRLVLDLQRGETGSFPRELTAFQGRLFFSAEDPGIGAELWQSDGTVAGTGPVADIQPGAGGSSPRFLTVHAGRLWFFAWSEHGQELWSSDGTEAGTRLEVELPPGAQARFLVSLGDRLVFDLIGNGISGNGIWVSDGTPAGTFRVHGRNAESGDLLAVFQGRLYYVSEGELWVTDGTAAGTGPLVDRAGNAISGVFRFAALGDRLVFITIDRTANVTLWESDGTPAGTFPLHPPFGVGTLEDLVRAGDRIFFPGFELDTGTELWAVRE